MPGGMRYSRWWGLLERMISTRRISMPAPILQRNHREQTGRLQQRNAQNVVMGGSRALQQGQPSPNSFRRSFAKA
jgi:hypothetical protein